MNIYMILAPILLVIGLFGLYDKTRLFRRNGVFPSDSRLYRWFFLLFVLVLPVRNLQYEFAYIKLFYYVLIPIVVIWLLYSQFREGKAYTIVDISDTELSNRIEQLLRKHNVKFVKETQGNEEFHLSYQLVGSDSMIVLNRSRDILNETHMYSYTLTFKKWWKYPNSEIIIDDLIRNLQSEREPIKLRKQRVAAVAYGIIFIVGAILGMNTFGG